ncbi:PREDICTED: uncharacterized protein LOC104821990 [Tarenaya hassleriana]|uniref:uncharacterized protein LOC104821990 n=1 Tax=Tarenaya hassleriana TaxID=28532 RepID=UPI00053C7568|nr:PREDICTED: uncharacterized protein LOC104821990 [Tarenaya hassleriana]
MEDLWKRAKSFAEEAAKKSQTLTLPSSSTTFANLVAETAKKSKELALEASKKAENIKVSDLVAETAKKSKEFAVEASKKADQLKVAALKQADQIQNIRSIADIIPPQLASFGSGSAVSDSELLRFGITDDLREFVKGLTSATFQAFPVQDVDEQEPEVPDVPAAPSNIRKDLSEWQERHATLVLATVKQISKLRYELCPRVMKERRFWRIYFTLVSTHVSPYEKKYMEELKNKAESKDEEGKKAPVVGETGDAVKNVTKNRTSTSSSTEQDLDTFLLGDLEDSDGGPDDGDESLDDDFDKIGNSDVEDEKHSPKAAAN